VRESGKQSEREVVSHRGFLLISGQEERTMILATRRKIQMDRGVGMRRKEIWPPWSWATRETHAAGKDEHKKGDKGEY
jgi:hypothetical protein